MFVRNTLIADHGLFNQRVGVSYFDFELNVFYNHRLLGRVKRLHLKFAFVNLPIWILLFLIVFMFFLFLFLFLAL